MRPRTIMLRPLVASAALAGCAPASEPAAPPPAAAASEWAGTDARYAKLSADGVDWIAVGQEPGWTAEVKDGERITVLADYGERKAVVPAPAANAPGAPVEYHSVTETDDVRLTITREPCADAMSGRPYPARAVLILNGRRYEGCAQPL